MANNVCERCNGYCSKGHRYCRKCGREVIKELDNQGKLSPRVYGHVGSSRTAEKREDIQETKRGRDG